MLTEKKQTMEFNFTGSIELDSKYLGEKRFSIKATGQYKVTENKVLIDWSC